MVIFTYTIPELTYSLSSFAADNSLKQKMELPGAHVCIAKQGYAMGVTWRLGLLLLRAQQQHLQQICCWQELPLLAQPALTFWVNGTGKKSLSQCPRAALHWEQKRNPLQRAVLDVNWNASIDPPRKHKPINEIFYSLSSFRCRLQESIRSVSQ